MKRHRAAALVVGLLLIGAVPAASQETASDLPEGAFDAMYGFLDAWLIEQNGAATISRLAAVDRPTEEIVELAAQRDAESFLSGAAFWAGALDLPDREPVLRILKHLDLFAVGETDHQLEAVLAPIDPDLMEVLVGELGVHIVQTKPFTVFFAHNDIAIDSFDAGYGDVATALRPSENMVLVMIADFADRNHEEYSGPFVAFWAENEMTGQWQIQALGAAPEGRIWRDGK